jgi:hypothetical protein
MRRLRFIIDTLFLIVLNCDFFRVTRAAAPRRPVKFAVVDTEVRKTGRFLSQLPLLLTKQAKIRLRFAPTVAARSAPISVAVPQGFVRL